VCACVRVCVRLYVCVRARVCVYACVCAYVYAYVDAHNPRALARLYPFHPHTRTHAHTTTRTHAHTHTCTHAHTGVWHSGMCLGLAYYISAVDGGAASAQSALEATPTARRPRSNVLNTLPNAVQMRQDDATTRT